MKRAAFILTVIMVLLFTGCSEDKKIDTLTDDTQLLTVYYKNSQNSITMGQTRDEANAVTGGAEAWVGEMENGNERANYYDVTGIAIDFTPEGKVVAFRLSEKEWYTAGGIKCGMTKAQIEEILGGHDNQDINEYNRPRYSFDENMEPVSADSATYWIYFKYDNDVVTYITIENAKEAVVE